MLSEIESELHIYDMSTVSSLNLTLQPYSPARRQRSSRKQKHENTGTPLKLVAYSERTTNFAQVRLKISDSSSKNTHCLNSLVSVNVTTGTWQSYNRYVASLFRSQLLQVIDQ